MDNDWDFVLDFPEIPLGVAFYSQRILVDFPTKPYRLSDRLPKFIRILVGQRNKGISSI